MKKITVFTFILIIGIAQTFSQTITINKQTVCPPSTVDAAFVTDNIIYGYFFYKVN